MKDDESAKLIQRVNWDKHAIYLAKPSFQYELQHELKDIQTIINNLFIAKKDQEPVFALDIWKNPQLLPIDSINDAVKKLKALQSYWYPYPELYARRTLLIAENFPYYKNLKNLSFPCPSIPSLGVFTLLTPTNLIYATKRSKLVPNGCYSFKEDKINPPNRAYLKLWEALAILNRYPKANEFALDLGASPGGWTYVLQQLGVKVLAIDKAPLAENIAKLSGVTTKLTSAFSLKPQDFDSIDWLVADIACYPKRLYQWLIPWLESGKVTQFIITIKLQGKTDFESIQLFQAIHNSKVLHLFHNKHEVTFFYPSP
ncbi:MAG: hypothetical protein A3E87_07330 [Gammaproteobacteria bacterium RIFCSPHIGHO2_12_FULL_35_23]|nr:MAG: hypothetical protein A3E87_07330 [Gammaproteobacteria bacterium RIFCSPHIGHO2_12_FULL_35_23]